VTVLTRVTDPDGQRVELLQADWTHIISAHPEMSGLQTEVLRAVAAPDRRRVGHEPNEKWFYLRGAGPSSWIKAVVVFDQQRGRIITAFPRRTFP
jgi:hypothetical protein